MNGVVCISDRRVFKHQFPAAMEGFINDGDVPYPGIALDSCVFSDQIKGRDILLIDDIYTKTVNIDEDMVQALFEQGARLVIFYAIGYTVYRNKR